MGPLAKELFGVLKQIQDKTSADVGLFFLRQEKIFNFAFATNIFYCLYLQQPCKRWLIMYNALLLFFKITFFVLTKNNIFSGHVEIMFYLLYSILCRVYS